MNVLVVEDDPITRAVLKTRLDHSGYRVDLAPDGKTGLEKILNERPDLIILDVQMPGISGIDVHAVLRASTDFESIPVIFNTSSNMTEELNAAISHEFTWYWPKQGKSSALLDLVSNILDRSAHKTQPLVG